MAVGVEDSVVGETTRQLRSDKNQVPGKSVHFSLCSNDGEEVDAADVPQSSAPRLGHEIAAVPDVEGHSVDPFVASKFCIMLS